MNFDVKVFINGVEIVNDCVLTVGGLKSARVPDTGGCNIVLLNKQKVFWGSDEYKRDEKYEKMNEKLKRVAVDRGVRVLKNVPMIYDNDIVWVFLRIGNKWYWGFFGYVDGYSEEMDVEGGDVISVHCRNSLKMLELSRKEFHALFVPYGMDMDKVKRFLSVNITPLIDNMQGKSFYDKIDILFDVKRGIENARGEGFGSVTNYMWRQYDIDEVCRGIEAGVGFFEKGLSKEIDLRSEKSEIMRGILDWYEEIGKIFEIGNEDMLRKVVDEMRGLMVWNGGFVVRKYHVLKLVGDVGGNDVWTQLSMSVLLGRIEVSDIKGERMIDLLKNVLDGMLYVGYVLPNGDVVIEPAMFGLTAVDFATAVNKKWKDMIEEDRYRWMYIGNDSVLSLTTGYSGSDIVTMVKNFYQIGNPASPAQKNLVTNVPSKVLLINSVEKYGIREAVAPWFVGRLVGESLIDIVNRLEMVRRWYHVRGCNVIVVPDRIVWVNRPVYVEMVDGFYICESVDMRVDTLSKMLSVSLVLKGGKFGGMDGNYYMDFNDEDMKNVIGEGMNVVEFFSKYVEELKKTQETGSSKR